MRLIVGLGNPGILYSSSRHNIGFQVVKNLAKTLKVVLKKEKGIKALSVKAKIEGVDVVLALPLTFMNLSGEAVRPLLEKHKVGLNDLLVVCDDLDLEFGRIKIHQASSSAGHRGIQSIIDYLGSNKFNRVRVGIGRPSRNLDASRFVLTRFNKIERSRLLRIISRTQECCLSWVSQGLEKSMSVFNKKELE